jgi:hypothetical protein
MKTQNKNQERKIRNAISNLMIVIGINITLVNFLWMTTYILRMELLYSMVQIMTFFLAGVCFYKGIKWRELK